MAGLMILLLYYSIMKQKVFGITCRVMMDLLVSVENMPIRVGARRLRPQARPHRIGPGNRGGPPAVAGERVGPPAFAVSVGVFVEALVHVLVSLRRVEPPESRHVVL